MDAGNYDRDYGPVPGIGEDLASCWKAGRHGETSGGDQNGDRYPHWLIGRPCNRGQWFRGWRYRRHMRDISARARGLVGPYQSGSLQRNDRAAKLRIATKWMLVLNERRDHAGEP